MIEPAQVPPRWGSFPSSDRGLRANSRDGGGRRLLVGFEIPLFCCKSNAENGLVKKEYLNEDHPDRDLAILLL